MTVTSFAIDVPAVIEKRSTLIEQTAGIDPADLRTLTVELYNRLEDLIEGIDDQAVVFVPDDPDAKPDAGPGWTLGHVIVHLTAGMEENASQGCTLARGAEITGRPRFETPWTEVTTADQIRQRLAESRRMALAFLDAWPDAPHRTNVHEHPFFGPTDAVSYHAMGINHALGHLAQIEEIRRQAGAAAS